jgi:NitT/TauT family transport system ATP-binding protein
VIANEYFVQGDLWALNPSVAVEIGCEPQKELRAVNLVKEYISKSGNVKALANASFTVSSGEFVSIVGPSGCGKSTLLRMLAGLIKADSGHIQFSGWVGEPKRRLVFQDHVLFPWMTVIENVAFGLEMEGVGRVDRLKTAAAQLTNMGIMDFSGHYPQELSGGMRQRAAIARAFVTEPDILLMDEPLRALDAQMRLVIQEEMLSLWEAKKYMVIYVTHDIEEALLLADRVLVMSGQPGHIREAVVPPFERPRDLTGRGHPELEELKWHIWNMLEREVRQKLRSMRTTPG